MRYLRVGLGVQNSPSWLFLGNVTGFWNPRVLLRVYPGYGSGYRLLYPPRTRTRGMGTRVWSEFKLRSKARETASSAHISAHHNHQPPRKLEQDSKGGEWVVHPPISLEGMLSIGQDYVLIMTNSKLCRFPVVPHIPPPSKTSTCVLVFDGGWLSLSTTFPPSSKTSAHACFRWWLDVFHHHLPTTVKNEHACLF